MGKTREAIEEARTLVNQRMDAVAVEADLLIEQYWTAVNAMKAKTDIKDWSKLGCRIIKRPSTGGVSLRLTWYSSRFFKSKTAKENWKVISTEIKPNAKTGKYNLDDLKKHAPEWSYELVENTEYELSKHRKQIQLLGKLRRSISRAITELEKMERNDFA